MTVPAPLGGGTTPIGGGTGTNSPAPRAGFTRIGSAATIEAAPTSASGSGTGTPLAGEHRKVAFGFGAKRKAEDDAPGTPPAKRYS